MSPRDTYRNVIFTSASRQAHFAYIPRTVHFGSLSSSANPKSRVAQDSRLRRRYWLFYLHTASYWLKRSDSKINNEELIKRMKLNLRTCLFLLLIFSLPSNALAKTLHEEIHSVQHADLHMMDQLGYCPDPQNSSPDEDSCKTDQRCKATDQGESILERCNLFQLSASKLSTLTAAGPAYDCVSTLFPLYANTAVWRPPMS